MKRFLELLTRGLLCRCPVCGRGKLFRSLFGMYKQCSVCGLVFEREVGYFSSAMAINLVISEVIVGIVAVAVAANQSIPVLTALLWGIPLPFILPTLFYRHSRSLWLAMDHYINPPAGRGFVRPIQSTLPQPADEK